MDMNERIDVLAVMASADPCTQKGARDMGAARAAVAELIEAAKVFANDDRQRAWHPAYRPQMDALHAALARVGAP